MPSPITLTDEMKQKARKEFDQMLDKTKMSDGRIEYSENFGYMKGKAIVRLTSQAYNKTVALVNEFSDEVAWHGTVRRSSENEFIIEDIFVYPQQVTGSTVNTDQSEYSQWLYGLDDESFSNLRMQGHSHVNMSVNPSDVDDKHRKQILEQLETDMFYIFMVWNKSLNIHTLVYDMENNILYDCEDVDVQLLAEDSIADFIADAKGKVRKATGVKAKKPAKIKQDEYPYPFCGMEDIYDLGGELWMC